MVYPNEGSASKRKTDDSKYWQWEANNMLVMIGCLTWWILK